jgi:OmpA-OmpF porin, OOP family
MRHGWCVAALVALGAGGAVRAQDDTVPYLGLAAQHLLTDDARGADDGLGFQLSLGVPLRGASSLEVRVFDVGYERAIGGQDVQTGLFVDWVRTLGPFGGEAGFAPAITPFFVLGAGLVREDIQGSRDTYPGASAGAGLLVPLGWRGLALRFDARVQPQLNDQSAPGASSLLDYQLNLGLQLPLDRLAEPPVELPPPVECPLAVVDPRTGRTDCLADTDGDGVADANDECPGTRPGTAVDQRGCAPPPRAAGDGDRDGVPDVRDQCPDTQAGLQVDAFGCVVAQTVVLRGVTFEPDSSRLTQEGRQTLDGVAATLRDQEQLKVEIAGHTDAIGSEAYNTLLSQQRADAVRTYLVVKGVSAERMVAAGYGELEPVASNETEEGRRANRRVEFRIAAE